MFQMRTVSKALLALVLFWSVGASAQRPAPYLPDPALTPGDVFDVTVTDICTPRYSKAVRAVPRYLREQVFRSYGIEPQQRGDYQLDHLIPLAIGGSNSVRNLWPQPHNTSLWDTRAKDRLENRLLRFVCTGKLDLQTAQQEIAADWTQSYRNFMGTSQPVVAKGEPLPAPNVAGNEMQSMASAPNAAEGEVWVNTRSGVYWKQGSQYFGKTKRGEFMTESDAVAGGYRPARGTGY